MNWLTDLTGWAVLADLAGCLRTIDEDVEQLIEVPL